MPRTRSKGTPIQHLQDQIITDDTDPSPIRSGAGLSPCGLPLKLRGTGYGRYKQCVTCQRTVWRFEYGDWVQTSTTCPSRDISGYGCADMTEPSVDMEGYDEWCASQQSVTSPEC